MEGQLISTLQFLWPMAVGIIFSILSICYLLKKNRSDGNNYSLSLSVFIILIILLALSLLFVVGANDSTVFFIAGAVISLGMFFSFLSLLYSNSFEHQQYQRGRNKFLWVVNILYILAILATFGRALVLDLASGMLLGVSNKTALAEATKLLSPGWKYSDCTVGDKVDYYENGKPAYISVSCPITLSEAEAPMYHEILINARSGKVMYLDNEYLAKITIKKDGKPLANTKFFSGRIEKNERMGDYLDFSAANSDGVMTILLIPGYTTRIYSEDYKYIDIDESKHEQIELNWDNAKQLPKNGLLFNLDPYGSSYYSPYDNHSHDVANLPTKPSSSEWKIYRNNRTNYQIEYPSTGLELDIDETIKLGGTGPADSASKDLAQFVKGGKTYSIQTIANVPQSSIETWLQEPENTDAVGNNLSEYEKTLIGGQTAYRVKEIPTIIFVKNLLNIYVVKVNAGNGVSTDTTDPIFTHLVDSLIFTQK